ncbi:Ig-like domain-containing protein [Agaribacter flavus]|uniref:Ig-like domain-containing protein n=1 Tax=Agaribacter flavus TaxID=1902781 RepID=A0ABV7FMV3_9ALTE
MKHSIRTIWFISVALLLFACGGGGEPLERTDTGATPTPAPTPNPDPTPDTPSFSLSLSLLDADGENASQVSSNMPLTVQATLTDQDGQAVAQELVTFSFNTPDLARFDNDTGTALTNAEGVAVIQIFAATLAGSGNVNATIDAGVSASIGFTSSPTNTSFNLTVTMVDENGLSSTLVEDGAPLTVNALVTNQDDQPVNNELVTFVFSQDDLARFGNDTGTALTNENGIASINIYAESLAGSANITASIAAGNEQTVGFTSAGSRQQQPSTLELFANNIQLPSSGSDQIELIAVVKNDKNILLSDIPVSFSANQNSSLSSVDLATGEDGTARALLSTQNNPENRVITVVASTTTLTQELQINVVGTEINLNGASSVIIDDVSPITIIVSDSDGKGIADQDVQLTTDLGVLSETEVKTGANGQVTVNYSSSSAGQATIVASALNASTEFSVAIQQDDFSFSALPEGEIELNQSNNLTLRWFKNGIPFANGDVIVTSSRGNITVNGVDTNETRTDSNGLAVVQISSAFAGPSSISAVGTDTNGETVTARATVEFIATNPNNISVDATPDLVGPEGQTSTITAIVRDAAGNLVKGTTVDFTIVADSTGGSISPNTAITDSNGIATTVYTSNAVSSENGILIKASSGNAEGETNLTVGDRAFDISLGTGNIIQSPDNASYLKEFAVFVTDAAGRPIAGADLTVTGTPSLRNAYSKGVWMWSTDANSWVSLVSVFCDSEDSFVENNNRLDAGEDFNGDELLTPGNVAAVSFKDGISRTDDFGQATVEVRYPRQFGEWVTIDLKVFGQSLGTESSEVQRYTLPVAAADLTDRASPPPANPFGMNAVCSDTN